MHTPWFAALVHGPSMVPTLRHGDAVLVRRLATGSRRVRPGDVVVVRFAARPGALFVKRVARREGEGWWVLGDNPLVTDDSRAYGPAQVVGRVLCRWWPRPGWVRRRAMLR
jgi:nickel-type superoxide dismutase maturation protease